MICETYTYIYIALHPQAKLTSEVNLYPVFSSFEFLWTVLRKDIINTNKAEGVISKILLRKPMFLRRD